MVRPISRSSARCVRASIAPTISQAPPSSTSIGGSPASARPRATAGTIATAVSVCRLWWKMTYRPTRGPQNEKLDIVDLPGVYEETFTGKKQL